MPSEDKLAGNVQLVTILPENLYEPAGNVSAKLPHGDVGAEYSITGLSWTANSQLRRHAAGLHLLFTGSAGAHQRIPRHDVATDLPGDGGSQEPW